MSNIRKEFPFLNNKKSLIYFDNAATSQKPQVVIDAITNYYAYQNAPVHRGIYQLAEQVTELYEQSRKIVAEFIGSNSNEIIFTKGTTESINFVASTWAYSELKSGDEIILTELEHHSNILPWVNVAGKKNLKIKYVPVTQDYQLDYNAYLNLLSSKTKLVSFTHESNALGTKIDAEFMVKHAHEVGAKVLIDAAQSVAHEFIDIKKLQPDFLVFSGHKILGPTGIGILYISQKIQEFVPPYQFGGGMVFDLGCDINNNISNSSWLKSPQKYEAGTPPIAQAIGLAAAINYLKNKVDFKKLKEHEASLCSRLISGISSNKKIKILGPVDQLIESGHIVSFVIDGIHSHDLAAYLGSKNICVRAGNHCAQLLFKKLKIDSSIRASFYLYNTQEEVDIMINVINEL